MSLQVRNPSTGLLERVAGFNDTDTILSPTSSNPIANKSVYAALTQKIDKTVNDLINYYTKSQTYSQEEVRALIGAISTLTIEVVAQLPTQDISTTTIYFVGPTSGKYDEYVYVNNAWVQIGDTTLDLSNYLQISDFQIAIADYYTQTEINNLLDDYYDKDAVDNLLDTKQDTLTFDNQPIAGSSNVVTSAGIKTALDNILISGNGGSIIKVHHLASAAAAGNTVTASKGSYSVSSTFDVSGDAIIIGFGEIGNITITCSNGSETGTTHINIPCFSNYSATISYGLDYVTWLVYAGIDPSYYHSLDEVFADEEAVRKLMTKHASVDYLATVDRVDDEMVVAVLNNDVCAKWINLRDYALDTLYANEYTKAIMDEADKYGYGEWALIGQVPTMTSNTAPYGEVISSGAYSSYPAYYAFDGNIGTTFASNATTPINQYCGFKFPQAIRINEISFIENIPANKGIHRIYSYNIEASNDNTNWIKLAENVDVPIDKDTERIYHSFKNENAYLYYRIYCVTGTTQPYRLYLAELQFYAWQPKGNVPAMTSDTAPYGQVLSDGYEGSRYAWYAFDGNENTWWDNGSGKYTLGYAFTNPICSKRLKLYAGHQFNFDIEGSNDGTNWTKIGDGVSLAGSPITVDFSNSDYYLRYRINVTNLADFSIRELQFYGREMKVSVPAMTSNTAPYGKAVCSAEYATTYQAWNAFNKSSPSEWASPKNATIGYIGYKFTKKVSIRQIVCSLQSASSGSTYKVQYSDDGTTWYDTVEDSTFTTIRGGTISIDIEDNGSHLYWRAYGITISGQYYYMTEMNLFGFDYSERDWDTEYPMTYLYDHGVEPTDIITSVANTSGNLFVKEPSRLTMNKTVTNVWNMIYSTNQIDVTSYTLARAISTDGTGINGATSLGTCNNLSTGSSDSYKMMATNLAPYHQYDNIASVNTSRWVGIGISTTATGNIAISEWWLE